MNSSKIKEYIMNYHNISKENAGKILDYVLEEYELEHTQEIIDFLHSNLYVYDTTYAAIESSVSNISSYDLIKQMKFKIDSNHVGKSLWLVYLEKQGYIKLKGVDIWILL